MTAEKIILLVEDNDDLASLYQHYLMNAYQVRLAQTGKEAIRKATPAVDLIILDYKLPDMLGTDVYDQLRANGSTTPVVLISGSDPESLPD
ncbi:response regulator transcription factor, partial [Halorubrum sp. SP9]|uniref:response regulator transcription factor n=2 Tax=Halorubrum TaxID=56688 RepID=UPI0010F9E258